MKKTDRFMAGTQGTGEYHVVAATKLGRVGYRPLSDGTVFRVRVEPRDQAAAVALAGDFPIGEWKQPGFQFRFSKVIDEAGVLKTLRHAIDAVGSVSLIGPIKDYPNAQ